MHKVNGGCHCGNIAAEVELTAAPETYLPRGCDCDFCRKHGAAWLSDAKGSLLIQIKDPQESSTYRQGSEQAEFFLCRNCGVLVVVLYQGSQRLYATVNVKALDSTVKFGAEQAVSPKKLSADEKASRWQGIWFSNVRIHGR
jgi:hypothetical protein